MRLEDLVPPPELCQQIPDGDFADSALVWVIKPEVSPEVWERAKAQNLPNTWKTFPAPTLAEIMDELYEQNDFVGAKLKDGVCQVGCFKDDDDEAKVVIHAESMATAALKLWMDSSVQL